MVSNSGSGRRRKRGVFGQVCCLVLLGGLAACSVDDNLNMNNAFPPSLSGTVTNAVTKAGIAGATVSAQGQSGVTGPTGYYVFGDFKAGTYKVKVSHPDYVDSEREVSIQKFLQPENFQLQPK
jgi:Carboxypeptidase regulatory-like domain